MSDSQKTVFISYRRSVSKYIARAIFMDLRHNGYDVFLDTETIDSGAFDTIILNQIAARAHFLVILTAGTLDRCSEPGDWLRTEIEHAIDLQRNVVPVLIDEFTFDEVARRHLTGKLSDLTRLNGLKLHYDYFDEAMERLRKRYLRVPHYGTLIPTPLAEEKKIKQKIEDVAHEPQPTREELDAEALFFRGVEKQDREDWDGAIQYYTAAIQLNPSFLEAYGNRGLVFEAKGDLNSSLADFNRVIELNPMDALAHYRRGTIWLRKSKSDNALADWSKALEINPDYIAVHLSMGAYHFNHNLIMAINHLKRAIDLDQDQVDIIYVLYAISHFSLRHYKKAKQIWQILLDRDKKYFDPEWVNKQFNFNFHITNKIQDLICLMR